MPITCQSDRIIMVILYDMGFPIAEIANDLGVNVFCLLLFKLIILLIYFLTVIYSKLL